MWYVVLTDNAVVVSSWHTRDCDYLVARKDGEARCERGAQGYAAVAQENPASRVRDMPWGVRDVPLVVGWVSERALFGGNMDKPCNIISMTNFPYGTGMGRNDLRGEHNIFVGGQRCGAHKGEDREKGEEDSEQGGHAELHDCCLR